MLLFTSFIRNNIRFETEKERKKNVCVLYIHNTREKDRFLFLIRQMKLKQVFNAFRRDVPFLVRNHEATSKSKIDLSNLEKEEKFCHSRSRSLEKDQHHSNEHKNLSRSSSLLKRQWECQLCKMLNETDCQLCSNCGSSQINIYIPTIKGNASILDK